MSRILYVHHQLRGTPRRRTATRRHIIHHSYSGDVSSQTIHEWHLQRETDGRPWLGIGYHFVIRRNGGIETGRAIDTVGAHAGASANGDSIGTCITGNFEVDLPTPQQIDSLLWLHRVHLRERYGDLELTGHNQHMATSCPGTRFPWAEVRRRLNEYPEVTLYFNNQLVTLPTRIEAGRTQVLIDGQWFTIRAMVDAFPGMHVTWDQATRTARIFVR